MFKLKYDRIDVCLSPFVISGLINHYKVVYCPLQKHYRQPLKRITFLTTRPRSLAQRQRQGRGLQGKAKNFGNGDEVKIFVDECVFALTSCFPIESRKHGGIVQTELSRPCNCLCLARIRAPLNRPCTDRL